jgi:phosphoesterase RecJ-like protein
VEIAKALYTGMVTDTGVFKYNNTSPKTMRVAAELISYGFDFGSLIDHVFYEKTYIQNQIL